MGKTLGKRQKKKLDKPTKLLAATKAKCHWTSVTPPNHLLSKFRFNHKKGSSDFPLLKLSRYDDSRNSRPIFFDADKYGMQHWSDRDQGLAPTWMDPETFMDMVDKDGRMATIVGRLVGRPPGKIPEILQRLLLDVYRVQYARYAEEQFTAALPVLVEWVVAHYAQKMGD